MRWTAALWVLLVSGPALAQDRGDAPPRLDMSVSGSSFSGNLS